MRRFTVLWCVLISYGVAMIFHHALALNDPFNFGEQDVKLNRLSAQLAYEILINCFVSRMDHSDLIDDSHETPQWLEKALHTEIFCDRYANRNLENHKFSKTTGRFHWLKRVNFSVLVALLALILWNTFIVLLTRRLSQDEGPESGVRWWFVYVPIDSDTIGYVSLGAFVLLGFWVNDAYNRYWRALRLWEMEIRPKVLHFAFQLSIICKRELWHHRDRERLMSYLAALPYAAMLHFRCSRDVSILDGILSPKDITMLSEAPALHEHIMNVLFAYVSRADAEHLRSTSDKMTTFGSALLMIYANVEGLEASLLECDVIRKYPISPALYLHLRIYTVFWLALLPLVLVTFHGFVSYAFLVPIGYSILNLLCVGQKLADPFGKSEEDLPLLTFCEEIKKSVCNIYFQAEQGVDHFVREANYSRERLTPREPEQDVGRAFQGERELTIRELIKKAVNWLPSVPIVAQVLAVVWSFVAVFLSWGLSQVWKDNRQSECRHWCSPIDVQASVLADVGFALFLILTLRASDGMARYSEGAKVMGDLEMNLRNVALEIVQAFPDGTFHQHDKERIVSHVAQIPLTFCDLLSAAPHTVKSSENSVLCDEDRALLASSPLPLDHLLQTIESYFITKCTSTCHERLNTEDTCVTYPVTHFVIKRMHVIRQLLAQALSMKRFPIIRAYKTHQHTFAVIWLMLLPFSMAPQTGFFAIAWSSVISYAVLAMEHLATSLANPYGHDSTNLPVDEICMRTSAAVFEAVDSVEWNCNHHIRQSEIDLSDRLGVIVSGHNVYSKHSVASSFFPDIYEDNDEKLPPIAFSGPRKPPAQRTIFAHLLRSVPWLVLFSVTTWSVFACVMSYFSRTLTLEQPGRWWTSFISVSGDITSHLSVAAFTLLSFYVRASYERYNRAALIWYDYLRAYSHALLAQLLSFCPHGEIHRGDHRRIVGHIAALPIVLKHELRHSRDLREIKALVSSSDLARIECAESMAAHCLDVVRAYFYKIMALPGNAGIDVNETKDKSMKLRPRRLTLVIYNDLTALEQTVQDALILNRFDVAPGFLSLLKTILGLWFILLPFVLSELSGWFTILWIPIISYGLLGMFNVAAELQHPYGEDLNDFNLDKEVDHIVIDILDTYRRQPDGFKSLIRSDNNPLPEWTGYMKGSKRQDHLFSEEDKLLPYRRLKRIISLAVKPVSWWVLVATAIWSAAAVTIAFLVNKYFKFGNGNLNCSPWFCSAIAVDGEIKEYIDFALFMLLGFRLTDSHFRYVRALQVWQEEILGMTRVLTCRLFASYKEGTWHESDLQRLAGHIAAFPISVMGGVRDKDYREKLSRILDDKDVESVLATCEQDDYCIDVVRAYLISAEEKVIRKEPHTCSQNELFQLLLYTQSLGSKAMDSIVMARVPMAFGYVHHLRTFLFIWILLLPLELVESSGWITILWSIIITYGVVAIERWATALGEPHGLDSADIPLERLCNHVIDIIKYNFFFFQNGLTPLIVSDRKPFPSIPSDLPIDESESV